MKSTKLISTTMMLGALFLFSQHTEAKNNYSNKIAIFEDKPKADASNSINPSTTLEVLPEFTTGSVFNSLDKYTPEQLNRLIGVWPEHTDEAGTKVRAFNEKEETSITGEHLNDYSPEQFVDILGLTF